MFLIVRKERGEFMDFLPVFISKAQKRSMSPEEMALQFDDIKRSVEMRCSKLNCEFLEHICSIKGRVARGEAESTLGGLYRSEAANLRLIVKCLRKWIVKKGGYAYLAQAQQALDNAEELCHRRIKALISMVCEAGKFHRQSR